MAPIARMTRPRVRSRVLLGVTAAGMTALLAACGGGGNSATGTAPPARSATPGTQVTAGLAEYHITLSAQHFTPGSYTFTAKNDGKTEHALEIEGPGVENRTKGLMPGDSASLTVTLRPGTYTVYCPIDGHKDLGMKTAITVGAAAHAPVNNTPPPTPVPGNGY